MRAAMEWKILSCTILFFAFLHVYVCQNDGSNDCVNQKLCGDCIAAGPRCGWCTQEGFNQRCDLVENLIGPDSHCEYDLVVQPQNFKNNTEDFLVRNAVNGLDAIQLQPQAVYMKIRPHAPVKFNVTFRQAENYPVDLYYVMDLSYSMGDDKSKLAELGDLLAKSMADITSNVRLGFGSFVDKKTMPYVSMIPNKLISPCDGCAAPYGFHNQLRLTDDTSQFRKKVMAAPISGNLDSPEGGFDAIMQAITCQDKIGWREFSRKMLLFSTDANFHFAGDGKLGGIVKPNDGECYLDNDGYYYQSLEQDYPSVSQLSNKIFDNRVNVIFAVTENQVEMYKKLSKLIDGSVVGQLANDSSNVVELVRNNYKKITSKVALQTEGVTDGVTVSFKSKCLGNKFQETSVCEGLRIGDNVTFEISVEVTKCPKDRKDWKREIKIFPLSLSDKLIITLDMMCECDCEHSSKEQRNSPKCSGVGTYECGACTCTGDSYGKECQCDGSNVKGDDHDASCRRTNSSLVCEGQGECICGVCDCFPISPSDPNKRYSDTFCQCNDYTCDYYNDQFCGGPSRGNCKCGKCECLPGFTGKDCTCPLSKETCIAKNGKLCNGVGECVCGKCVCEEKSKRDGPTCEYCNDCEETCDSQKPCVMCSKPYRTSDDIPTDCPQNCSLIIGVDTPEEIEKLYGDKSRKPCHLVDDRNCIGRFWFEYDTGNVYVQNTKDCPEKIEFWWIILAIILAIVLIGLILLLIWRCYASFIDHREFAKFEKERQNAKWDTGENPIYKQATTTFNNPTYRGKKLKICTDILPSLMCSQAH